MNKITDRIHPIDATRGLWRLIKDEKDTEAVFVVVRAMAGSSIWKGFEVFNKTNVGQLVLTTKINLIDTTSNSDWLFNLPLDTFGHAYYMFMQDAKITAHGLVEASDTGERYDNPDFTRYYCRIRDSHDLQHVLTGYGRDGIGELCLLAFMYAQTRSTGLAFIAVIGSLSYARYVGLRPMFRALMYAYESGKAAVWLPGIDWEFSLGKNLEDTRHALIIRKPRHYKELLRE